MERENYVLYTSVCVPACLYLHRAHGTEQILLFDILSLVNVNRNFDECGRACYVCIPLNKILLNVLCFLVRSQCCLCVCFWFYEFHSFFFNSPSTSWVIKHLQRIALDFRWLISITIFTICWWCSCRVWRELVLQFYGLIIFDTVDCSLIKPQKIIQNRKVFGNKSNRESKVSEIQSNCYKLKIEKCVYHWRVIYE